MSDPSATRHPSRRDFLKHTSLAVAGGTVAGTLAIGRSAHAAGSETLKLGLIGCGGRGRGAALNALGADSGVRLTAMADTFEDQLNNVLTIIKQQKDKEQRSDQVAVEPDHCFTGFDAYQQLLATDVDVVILATPPHFRPAHLKAAIEAGKHVFCEKPVAVDPPGIRSVLATTEEARKKNLAIVSGLCYRYDLPKRETIQRIHDGAIGDVVAMQVNYNTGPLWLRPRKPNWSEMENQVANWLYYTWLSGDFNCEQHVHSLDKAAWVMHDEPPVKATGQGGRQVRVDPQWGNIFDHFAVVYEYANGTKLFSYCRQMNNCSTSTVDHILGTRGNAELMQAVIQGENTWQYDGPKPPNMYDYEHQELFASIRAGAPLNNGVYMARSTMMAIMGRMSAYTGQTLTWDQCMNSKLDLTPAAYEWGDIEVPSVAIPGRTAFI